MGGRNRWEKMVLRDGKQFNIKCKFVPALVELNMVVTDHTGRVLGTAKICRHFYFTFEVFKDKRRTGKRRLNEYSTSHAPKEYSNDVARWLISQHIPRYTE
ncbi:hypothetical protein [Vibrio phage D4]|nr:hypothetical protein vBVcaS_HC052 [Vibrio phage vB_VcaS_HC]UHD87311.1 hypothetical protein [Vibrio phage D4]WKV32811.1 hypothetical protein R21Y_50 [Vibrio phage vB_VhaS_R21Y]